MINVYLDDLRRCPKGFVPAKNVEECLTLLRGSRVNVLSLDFDLGPGQPTGMDLVRHMAAERLYAKEIYLHSSFLQARSDMYQVLLKHKPSDVKIVDSPVPEQLLRHIEASAPIA